MRILLADMGDAIYVFSLVINCYSDTICSLSWAELAPASSVHVSCARN